jgi:putative Holliday junction resolvase
LDSPKTILAFDFGLRRIGIAVGQEITASASPIGVVANRETGVDFERIANLQVPVRTFIEDLGQYGLPVHTVDERYTSIEAERVLKTAREQGTRGRISKDMIDSAAAVFIAERYLAGL